MRAPWAVLRSVLDEPLVSDAFAQQNNRSAVDVAQCILKLAAQGERDPQSIKCHVSNVFLLEAAALKVDQRT